MACSGIALPFFFTILILSPYRNLYNAFKFVAYVISRLAVGKYKDNALHAFYVRVRPSSHLPQHKKLKQETMVDRGCVFCDVVRLYAWTR